jgi:predicted DNA-binding transcriptional regulator
MDSRTKELTAIDRPHTLQMLFVHSALDDYCLNPYEFRVYARLVRRAGRGIAFESIASMATGCRMSERKVKDALNLLIAAGMIHKHVLPGIGAEYTLVPFEHWQPVERLEELRSAVMAYRCRPSSPQTIRDDQETQITCQTQVHNTDYLGTQHPDTQVHSTHKGNPFKAIQEEDPNTPITPKIHFGVCLPAAVSKKFDEDPRKSAPKDLFSKGKQSLTQFEQFWEQLRPEYRGDKKPAWEAFRRLALPDSAWEQMIKHRLLWERRATERETAQAGWVPLPKHLVNYLRDCQFETPVPEPRPLRSMPTSISGSLPTAMANSEAEQIAELKRLGIVGLDLLNGRAELEDDYAFAVDLVGTHRYSEILAHKDRLLEIHRLKTT